jgi:hypothetical protein
MGLKEVNFPFNIDSEEEVRIALAFYFKELGFSLSELSFEDSFQITLGHTAVTIKKESSPKAVGGKSDMLLVRQGQNLAIVETKGPKIKLTDEDKDQALSYARLLRQIPPYTILTNGQELFVYDTITTEILASGSPIDSSWWKNGKSYEGISLANRDEAIRLLVGFNFDILKQFCQKQIERNMLDLKSNISERKRYSPDLYVPRQKVNSFFEQFKSSTSNCFAIWGDSGTGKSNEVCNLAESINQKENTVALFYRGNQLYNGFTQALINDFTWEFEQDEKITHIIRRLSDVLQKHNARLYIFLDGIDEYIGELSDLKAELSDFITRLDPTIIRFCISCKAFDWPTFASERGETLNRLGQQTFPPVIPSVETRDKSDDRKINLPGVKLETFDNDELNQAWPLYKSAFSLSGNLDKETRQICQMPIMLRLVSETYQHTGRILPSNLTNLNIYDHYWSNMLGQFEPNKKRIAERIIFTLVKKMVESDQGEINEQEFIQEIDSTLLSSPAYNDVKRYGILVSQVSNSNGNEFLALPFDNLRSYIYTQKANAWNNITKDSQLASKVSEAINTRLGREALFFYLSIVDSYEMLRRLINYDLMLFIKIMVLVDNYKVTLTNEELSGQLEPFLIIYNNLRNQFPAVKQTMSPYTEGDAGLWLYDGWYGFRTLTTEYPQLVIGLDDETFSRYLDGTINEATLQSFMPADRKFIPANKLGIDLEEKIPATVGYTNIIGNLEQIIGKKLLNEENNPDLLTEKIHRIITSGPNTSWEGTPPIQKYYEIMDFSSIEEMQTASITELIERVNLLIAKWVQLGRSSDQSVKRWYAVQLEDLIKLNSYLEKFKKHSNILPSAGSTNPELFSYLHTGELKQTMDIVLSLAPSVISNAIDLVTHNFPKLNTEFQFYKFRNSRLLLELSRSSRNNAFRSDFLHLSYIWLPLAPAGPISIKEVELEDSLAEKFIENQWSAGNIFSSDVRVKNELDGKEYYEPHAVISRVRFPDNLPLTSQVYQLIMNEAANIFGNSFKRNHFF